MKISIIAAMDRKRGIGKANKLLFKISEDFKRFKALTSGHPIIMGRKTWDSLPIKPLPNRTNIVVTRDSSYTPEGAIVCNSIKDSIEKAEEMLKQVQHDNEKEVFIIGGGQIFEQALSLVDKLYLTIVDGDFGADAFFPDYSEFKKKKIIGEGESEDHKYTFLELERS